VCVSNIDASTIRAELRTADCWKRILRLGSTPQASSEIAASLVFLRSVAGSCGTVMACRSARGQGVREEVDGEKRK